MLTNLDVIKLYAEKDPPLLVEIFDDMYCTGWNEGAYYQDRVNAGQEPEQDSMLHFCAVPNEQWMNEEYDNEIFRNSDIERLSVN